ncbi:hypothetical protein PR048_003781 [Dryococelus australis]|uniref:Uncharacterized protein n=1 Tax=Dryococelus australis TaxID=614101 RepID=A0ABQ9IP45_9NEOP|nr:hypothetical protein PR048_003781 [Dryococelus australis]
MFIKLHGPSLKDWNPEPYTSTWLRSHVQQMIHTRTRLWHYDTGGNQELVKKKLRPNSEEPVSGNGEGNINSDARLQATDKSAAVISTAASVSDPEGKTPLTLEQRAADELLSGLIFDLHIVADIDS